MTYCKYETKMHVCSVMSSTLSVVGLPTSRSTTQRYEDSEIKQHRCSGLRLSSGAASCSVSTHDALRINYQ